MLALWLTLLVIAGCRKEEGWNHADGEACLSCHVGIEQAHGPVPAGECTICHGGDGKALEKESAHVSVPDDWEEIRGDSLPPAPHGYIKDFPPDMLDDLDPAYIQFINPGDIRTADAACGNCHPGYVEKVKGSVMTTNAGHYWPTRHYAGLEGQDAHYGSIDAEDTDWDGAEGTVAFLERIGIPADSGYEAAAEALAEGDDEKMLDFAYGHYLAKNCSTCHAAGYPKNNSRATYRSTGCTSCHVLYDSSGVYQGNDEAMPKNVPVYPAKHQITSDITVEQCATCHFQGGRIGLLFRGIREGGFKTVPEHAEVWNDSVYTHVPGYYIFDEDTTNDVDETPPDLHYEAGMVCVDCHVGSDVHGTGALFSSSKTQLDLRCEDCHGTPRESAKPDGEGVFRTSSGRALTQLYLNGDGKVALTGRVDKQEHVVPQPAEILESMPADSPMVHAMGPNEDDWAHPDSLTCDSCHTSWTQQCLGCHVNVDLRLNQSDHQTGTKTAGLTSGKRDWYSLDTVILCQGPDGRAQSCQSSQQTQLSVVGPDGELVLGETELDENGEPTGNYLGEFRTGGGEHDAVTGWAPFYQHTSSRKPRDCMECHRQDGSVEEWDRVKGVYGYGTGEFMLAGPDGQAVDALQFIGEDGTQVTRFAHPGTGPLPEDMRERALGVDLSEGQ
jgi:hypothetical protein